MLLHTIIFLTGGAILALELLASRIMTPYFGVSLYIWTGILSITLVSLALGYWLGGRVAGRITDRNAARLLNLYAALPAVAALAIAAACLAYPKAFAALAGWSLVAGAFVACLVLLFAPLVATSAMNPLLVAIVLREARNQGGDGGAGRVFFVSTLGSVAGVIVTAFVLIPHTSNFSATLIVAVTLALLSLACAFLAPVTARAAIAATALLAAVVPAVLIWQADAYTGRLGPVSYAGASWRVEETASSLFGTVKILRTNPDPATGRFARMYFHDGLTQNTVDSANRSMSFYTYALEALARSYRPDMQTALALGVGAGMVPGRLSRIGTAVDAVDIDATALHFARKLFGVDPAKVNLIQADARAFVHACPRRYDVAIVDLFHGDGTPDYLVTREFFRELRACLGENGIAVFNTFADLTDKVSYAHFLVTLQSELPHIVLYRPHYPGAIHVNSFVVAGAKPLAAPHKITMEEVPARHNADLWDMLARPTPITAELLQGGKRITDAHNAGALDLAAMQATYRRTVVEHIPPALLVN